MDTFSEADLWRVIVLFGLNTATYKIALGHCLLDFADQSQSHVSMTQLAEAFFDLYQNRLRDPKPQLTHPYRMTVMERVVGRFNSGKISRAEAIQIVSDEAFGDVIHRFHTVAQGSLPVKFYEYSAQGLVLTDSLFSAASNNGTAFRDELEGRWGLLEAAFQMKREGHSVLINDIRAFYLAQGYDRATITSTRPILNGYQNGICFYCGEAMTDENVHVDHIIPRQLVQHDEIWNLALSHAFCNTQKSDALPPPHFIYKMIERNEYFIVSNHPIKPKLIKQLGATAEARRKNQLWVYEDAKTVIRVTWEGMRGYNPATDPFYKSVVRSLIR